MAYLRNSIEFTYQSVRLIKPHGEMGDHITY